MKFKFHTIARTLNTDCATRETATRTRKDHVTLFTTDKAKPSSRAHRKWLWTIIIFARNDNGHYAKSATITPRRKWPLRNGAPIVRLVILFLSFKWDRFKVESGILFDVAKLWSGFARRVCVVEPRLFGVNGDWDGSVFGVHNYAEDFKYVF